MLLRRAIASARVGRLSRPALAIVLVTLAMTRRAAAVTVFSQSPSGIFAIPSVLEGPAGSKLQKADDFALSADATITHVRWWGRYASNNVVPDNFLIRFYDDDGGGLPELVPFAEVTPASLLRTVQPPDGAFTLFLYEADLSAAVPLLGLTDYHFSVVNDIPDGGWSWQTTGSSSPGSSSYRVADGDAWANDDQTSVFDLAFALETPGAIPEPVTAGLSALSLLGLIVAATRRRRAGL
jgi:hypothetical protein